MKSRFGSYVLVAMLIACCGQVLYGMDNNVCSSSSFERVRENNELIGDIVLACSDGILTISKQDFEQLVRSSGLMQRSYEFDKRTQAVTTRREWIGNKERFDLPCISCRTAMHIAQLVCYSSLVQDFARFIEYNDDVSDLLEIIRAADYLEINSILDTGIWVLADFLQYGDRLKRFVQAQHSMSPNCMNKLEGAMCHRLSYDHRWLEYVSCLRTLSSDSKVMPIVLGRDGTMLYAGFGDGTIKVSNAQTGKRIRILSNYSAVISLALSSDGNILYVGLSDGTIKMWHAYTGQYICALSGHGGGVVSLALSPDNGRLYSGSMDGTIKIWNAHTGEYLCTLFGHSDGVVSLALSPDNGRLYSGSMDGTIKIWNAHTGEYLCTLSGHSDGVVLLALSHDGNMLYAGLCNGTINIWNTCTGEHLCALFGHRDKIVSLILNPDGKTLHSGSEDRTIKTWRLFPSINAVRLEQLLLITRALQKEQLSVQEWQSLYAIDDSMRIFSRSQSLPAVEVTQQSNRGDLQTGLAILMQQDIFPEMQGRARRQLPELEGEAINEGEEEYLIEQVLLDEAQQLTGTKRKRYFEEEEPGSKGKERVGHYCDSGNEDSEKSRGKKRRRQ